MNKKNHLKLPSIIAMIFLALLMFSGPTMAQSTVSGTICIKMQNPFSFDAAVGDYINSPTAWYPIRGAEITISQNGNILFDGYTSPFSSSGMPNTGCTPSIQAVPYQAINVTLNTTGLVGASDIKVTNSSNLPSFFATNTYLYTSGSTRNILVPVNDMWKIYLAASHSIYREPPVENSAHAKKFNLKYIPGTDSRYESISDTIYIGDDLNDADSKFLVSHEVGHKITIDKVNQFDAIDVTTTCSGCSNAFCQSGNNDWGLLTKEWISAAAGESVASFYAALVWNSYGTNKDCFYPLNSINAINCDKGTSSLQCTNPNFNLSSRFMERCCSGLSDAGRGVAMDWMRTYWNLVDSNCAHIGSAFNEIMDVLSESNQWNNSNSFVFIDIAFNTKASSKLRTCWNYQSSFNGIDH